MRNCTHVLVWNKADIFPELSESDLTLTLIAPETLKRTWWSNDETIGLLQRAFQEHSDLDME